MLTLGQETIYMGTAAPGGGGSGDAVWGAITGILSNQTDLQTALNAKANSADLATVATSGSYNDLSNKPTIPTVIPADNSTITENASNELQTVGVINQNTANGATNPLKFWEGTEQEWEVGGITDTYYAWKGAGISPDEHSTYSTTYGAVFSGAYGNGKFVMVSKALRNYGFSYYSTDGGNTWTYNKPSNMFYDNRRVYYVNGRFIATSRNTPLYYSLDGITWTAVTTGAADGYALCWTGSHYITAAASSGGNIKYCTVDTLDSWVTGSSVNANVQALAYGEYGNNKYIVAVCEGAIKYITANDFYEGGHSWTILYQENNFYDVIYHDGKFVAVGLNCSAVVDITGSTPTLTLKGTITASTLVYMNGVYYAIGNFESYPSAPTTSNTLYYIKEEDLLTATDWSTYTLPETHSYSAVVTDGQKLILNDNGHAYFVKVDVAGEVFTLEAEPTTESTVYSSPKVESALTITSVGTGTITLSDTHTYDYTSADNQEVTNTVAESYPDVLCNIENVGLQKGMTPIANYANTFTGTNGTSAGTSGLVPAPAITDAGKFLSASGTWDEALVNSATGTGYDKLAILGSETGSKTTAIGKSSYAVTEGTAIGAGTSAQISSTAIGYAAQTASYGIAVGAESVAGSSYGVAIGYQAIANNSYRIQIGKGTNNDANPTLSIGFGTNGNYTLLDGTTGKIPNDRLINMTGATGSVAGTAGLIPAPSATDNDKFLCGNGTWSNVVTFENQNKADGAINPLKLWQGTEAQWDVGGTPEVWYAWTQKNATVGQNMPSSSVWYTVAYGNNKFVSVIKNNTSGNSAYSTNGTSWTSTGSSLSDVRKVIYGNNEFVAKSRYTQVYAGDGTGWSAYIGPQGYGICWDGTQYVCAPVNGGRPQYSSNLTDWTGTGFTLATINVQAIGYGKYSNTDYYVFVGSPYSSSGKNIAIANSVDDVSAITLSGTFGLYDVAYSNGIFMAVGDNSCAIDIRNGTPNVVSRALKSRTVIYADGYFYSVGTYSTGYTSATSSSVLYYIAEADAMNPDVAWSTITLPMSAKWTELAYGDNKLVIVADGSTNVAVVDLSSQAVYTSDRIPTTESTVYSAPDTPSALTVTTGGSNAIELSDTNIYYYSESANQEEATTVGDTHPDWLCFIDGVGVKMGNTVIAEVAGS